MKITVIGSINTDFVVEADKRPRSGETLQGNSFETKFGGKGANQAVASARLGVATTMIGAVGSDEFGRLLIDNFSANAISTAYIKKVPQISSGTAVITVVDGDNSIIYVAGANELLSPKMVEEDSSVLLESGMVLVQNEVTDEVIKHTIDFCFENKIPVLLNPAPARPLAKEYIDKLTYLTPNESEFEALFPGQEMEEVLRDYPEKLIITVGSKGAVYHNGTEMVSVPSFKPKKVVDTTGAGDTFNGAFAAAVVNGLSVEQSVKLANLAASLSIQKYGAQTGMPDLNEMKESPHYEKEWNLEQRNQ